jgi:hypothetical protein
VWVLYYWSALLAVASVGPAFVRLPTLAPWLVGAAGLGLALTALGVRRAATAAPKPAEDRADAV